MALPDEFIRELKSRNDIESVVSGYVHLKRRGRTLVGLCPFHSERSPSFTVYPDTDSFYCFGCQKGGDAITFIMNMENLDYIEAVRLISERSGLKMPENRYVHDDSAHENRMRIYAANRDAAYFYYEMLYKNEGREGLAYLREKRALSDRIIRYFGLGFAPDSSPPIPGVPNIRAHALSSISSFATVPPMALPLNLYRSRCSCRIREGRGGI